MRESDSHRLEGPIEKEGCNGKIISNHSKKCEKAIQDRHFSKNSKNACSGRTSHEITRSLVYRTQRRTGTFQKTLKTRALAGPPTRLPEAWFIEHNAYLSSCLR
ncbi:hypothetical protein QE152_g24524 [Popillia japonica]|uniref:Uncharacterized protein n=1 Tax=Popillia japonica TaxID=7064 RepID=A0AAW1KFK3_POPJA